jgi:hypothetical protein
MRVCSLCDTIRAIVSANLTFALLVSVDSRRHSCQMPTPPSTYALKSSTLFSPCFPYPPLCASLQRTPVSLTFRWRIHTQMHCFRLVNVLCVMLTCERCWHQQIPTRVARVCSERAQFSRAPRTIQPIRRSSFARLQPAHCRAAALVLRDSLGCPVCRARCTVDRQLDRTDSSDASAFRRTDGSIGICIHICVCKFTDRQQYNQTAPNRSRCI